VPDMPRCSQTAKQILFSEGLVKRVHASRCGAQRAKGEAKHHSIARLFAPNHKTCPLCASVFFPRCHRVIRVPLQTRCK
jgi:hypothetical protein